MKKLSNTEVELEKTVAYVKKCILKIPTNASLGKSSKFPMSSLSVVLPEQNQLFWKGCSLNESMIQEKEKNEYLET